MADAASLESQAAQKATAGGSQADELVDRGGVAVEMAAVTLVAFDLALVVLAVVTWRYG